MPTLRTRRPRQRADFPYFSGKARRELQVKGVSDLFAPLSGEVVEVNAALSKTPDLVNSDPYGDGWMMVVRLSTPAAVDGLMDAKAYALFVEMASA